MADDAYEERFRQHEEILRSLTAMLAAQHAMNQRQEAMNQRLEGSMQRLEAFNGQQVEINQGVKTTLARIETLLARMIRPADNGRDA